MGILEIIAGLRLIICSIFMILLVLAQQPKGGMGGAFGGGEMFADMRTRSRDMRIANVTKYAGIAFFVIAVLASAINLFIK